MFGILFHNTTNDDLWYMYMISKVKRNLYVWLLLATNRQILSAHKWLCNMLSDIIMYNHNYEIDWFLNEKENWNTCVMGVVPFGTLWY